MNLELETFNKRVQAATGPEVIFGILHGSIPEQLSQAKTLYRHFAFIAHVDRYRDADDQAVAHLAFSKLVSLWASCQERITSGIYGTKKASPHAALNTPPVIRSKKATYGVETGFAAGDISAVYLASSTLKDHARVLVKVSSNHSFNNFLELEAAVLTRLNQAAESTASYKKFIPMLLESFLIEYGPKKEVRRVNIFDYQEGFRPLTDILATYPEGIDQRHFVWIWNRLLTVLTFAHSQKLVHGAVLPTHVLIHPDTHAIQLIDWCFTVKTGTAIIALSNGFKSWYPPEVLAKKAATSATDLYMAAECMAYILGADPGTDVPATTHVRFRRLLNACLIQNPLRRTADAWKLYKDFQIASDEVFGKRQYIKLQLA